MNRLSMLPRRVQQISAEAVVPREELWRRIARAHPGTLTVQLRDPELSGRALWQLGTELRQRTRENNARLIVNDRADLAVLLDADGVHLGRRSMTVAAARTFVGARRLIIACSAHDGEEAMVAAAAGADEVVLSPIFASPGKRTPLGLQQIEWVRARLPTSTRLVALGGVTIQRAGDCFEAGANTVAAIRADLSLARLDGG